MASGPAKKRKTSAVVVNKATSKRAKAIKQAALDKNNVVLPLIELMMLQPNERDLDRRQDILHVSEVVKGDFCSTEAYLRISAAKGLIDDPAVQHEDAVMRFQLRRILDNGHDIHDRYQGWLWDAGELYGNFECLRCDYLWYAKAPQQCFKCKAVRKYLRYREVPVYSEKFNLGGHADGHLDVGLIEVKGIAKGSYRVMVPALYDRHLSGELTLDQMWRETRRPFPEHIKQGMIYGYLKKVPTVHFIYECKWNQDAKEFKVVVNEDVIEPYLDIAEDLKYRVEKQRPPRKPDWASATRARCKTCPYHKVCWSEEAEASQRDDTAARKPVKLRVRPKAA